METRVPWKAFLGSWRYQHCPPVTFIKKLFSSSSLFPIRVVSSAYLRLLIFLPAILIPAYASSSPAFLMMYSAYKLNKQGDNIQPWHALIWNQSVVPCPVLTALEVDSYSLYHQRSPGILRLPMLYWIKVMRVGESGHPCLVPNFRGNAFRFSPLSMMLMWPLLYWCLFPIYPICWC